MRSFKLGKVAKQCLGEDYSERNQDLSCATLNRSSLVNCHLTMCHVRAGHFLVVLRELLNPAEDHLNRVIFVEPVTVEL